MGLDSKPPVIPCDEGGFVEFFRDREGGAQMAKIYTGRGNPTTCRACDVEIISPDVTAVDKGTNQELTCLFKISSAIQRLCFLDLRGMQNFVRAVSRAREAAQVVSSQNHLISPSTAAVSSSSHVAALLRRPSSASNPEPVQYRAPSNPVGAAPPMRGSVKQPAAPPSLQDPALRYSAGAAAASAPPVRHSHRQPMTAEEEERAMMEAVRASMSDVQSSPSRAGSRRAGLPSAEEIESAEIVKELGQGGQGSLFLGRTRTGKEFVKKVIPLAGPSDNTYNWALQFQASIHHPNIIEYLHVTADPPHNPKEVAIFMPMYSEGDLEQKISKAKDPLPELFIADCVRQVASALNCLHTITLGGRAEPRLHRDLKPPNVLLADGGTRFVLIDFDSWGRTGKSDKEGTFEYMAPESHGGSQTTASDIFSLGCVLFALLALPSFMMLRNAATGEEMVLGAGDWGRAPEEYNKAIRRAIPSRKYDDTLVDLCLQMVSHDVNARPTAAVIESTLKRHCDRLRARADSIAEVGRF